MPKRSNPFADMPMPRPRPNRDRMRGAIERYMDLPLSNKLDAQARAALKRMKAKRRPGNEDLENDLDIERFRRKPRLRNA